MAITSKQIKKQKNVIEKLPKFFCMSFPLRINNKISNTITLYGKTITKLKGSWDVWMFFVKWKSKHNLLERVFDHSMIIEQKL